MPPRNSTRAGIRTATTGAGRALAAAYQKGDSKGDSKGEGSVLSGLGGMLSGDRGF